MKHDSEFLGVEGATEDKEGMENLFQLQLFWDCQTDRIGCRNNQKAQSKLQKEWDGGEELYSCIVGRLVIKENWQQKGRAVNIPFVLTT